MYSQIKEEVKKLAEGALGEDLRLEEIQDSALADIACTAAFRLAPKLKKSPVVIAAEAAAKMTPAGVIKRVEAANGYINFFLDYSKIAAPLLESVRTGRERYGRGPKKDRRVILEHTSINPSGPLHIGRIRNCLIGDSLARILRFSGYDVETHYFVNDVGKQIAIISRGFAENVEPDKTASDNYSAYAGKEDFQVFFRYVAANRKYEEDKAFAARVQEQIQKAESGDISALDEITSVAKKCLSGQKQIYDRLGVKFDKFDYESTYIRNGDVQKVFDFMRTTPYCKETEKGLGLDLKEFGIERRDSLSILARTDGTSVYLSRDIAYHLDKAKTGDILINVLGEDHKFEFHELSTILSKIYGIQKPIEVVHYSFVSFEGTELSTRKGQTAPVDKLLDEALAKAAEEIDKRGIAAKEEAPLIAYGAVKYHILKTSPNKTITFRWEDALSFEGESAPYIQYAHARCRSIVRKSSVDVSKIDASKIDLSLEKDEEHLIKTILRFSGVVDRCAAERRPNMIANYLYELAGAYSRFYKECPVLSSEEGVMNRRLLLVDATRQVLANGLGLLGIDAPEKM